MADVVEQIMERMLPEFEDLQGLGLYSMNEIRTIAAKRKEFEYVLRRRTVEQRDFVRYLKYEMEKEADRKLRKKAAAIRRITMSDHASVRRIHFIFERGARKFRGDISWWKLWIRYAVETHSARAIDKIFARALMLHPRCEDMWLLAAEWHFDHTHNMSAARVIFQRGLRVNNDSRRLWVVYFRMECLYVLRLKGRRVILGLDKAEPAEDSKEVGASSDYVPDFGEHELADEEDDTATQPTIDPKRRFLEGEVPRIVYANAVERVPDDPSFRLQFLDACDSLPSVDAITSGGDAAAQVATFPALAEYIVKDIAANFPTHALTWECLAIRPISSVREAVQRLRQASSVVSTSVSHLDDNALFIEDKIGDTDTPAVLVECAVAPQPTMVQPTVFLNAADYVNSLAVGNFDALVISKLPPSACCLPVFDWPLWRISRETDGSTTGKRKRGLPSDAAEPVEYCLVPYDAPTDEAEGSLLELMESREQASIDILSTAFAAGVNSELLDTGARFILLAVTTPFRHCSRQCVRVMRLLNTLVRWCDEHAQYASPGVRQLHVQCLLRLGRVKDALDSASAHVMAGPPYDRPYLLLLHLVERLAAVQTAVSAASFEALGALPAHSAGTAQSTSIEQLLSPLPHEYNRSAVLRAGLSAVRNEDCLPLWLELARCEAAAGIDALTNTVLQALRSVRQSTAGRQIRLAYLDLLAQNANPDALINNVNVVLSPGADAAVYEAAVTLAIQHCGGIAQHADKLRRLCESAVLAHGRSVQLWAMYLKFERTALSATVRSGNRKCVDRSGDIYHRAIRVLGEELTAEFASAIK